MKRASSMLSDRFSTISLATSAAVSARMSYSNPTLRRVPGGKYGEEEGGETGRLKQVQGTCMHHTPHPHAAPHVRRPILPFAEADDLKHPLPPSLAHRCG